MLWCLFYSNVDFKMKSFINVPQIMFFTDEKYFCERRGKSKKIYFRNFVSTVGCSSSNEFVQSYDIFYAIVILHNQVFLINLLTYMKIRFYEKVIFTKNREMLPNYQIHSYCCHLL